MRQTVIKPLVDDFFSWARDCKAIVDPSSALGKAIGYALNQEKYLRVFLSDPNIPLDNNSAEQAIRPFTVYPRNNIIRDE